MNLTILTISMRRVPLPRVARSVAAAVENAPGVDVRWNVVFNPPTRLPWAEHIARWNAELRALRATWFLILSDDNELHPHVIRRWAEVIAEKPEARALHPRAAADGQLVNFSAPEKTHVADGASIGAGCVVLPVRIGEGAMIGAGSVVVHDVPARTRLICRLSEALDPIPQ